MSNDPRAERTHDKTVERAHDETAERAADKNAEHDKTAERAHDKTLDESFPASDPPASSGITGAGTPDKPSHRRDEEEIPKGTPTSDRHATETAHHREDEHRPGPKT